MLLYGHSKGIFYKYFHVRIISYSKSESLEYEEREPKDSDSDALDISSSKS